MKKLIGILLYFNFLVSLCSFSTAQSTTGPDNEDCVWATEISFNNIQIAWKTSCYEENDESFDIQLVSDGYCETTLEQSQCNETCTIDIFGMDCYPDPTKACASAIFFITGSSSNLNFTLNETLAPQVTLDDWNLIANINNDTDTLSVSWGPPASGTSPDYVSCATEALVEASCMVIDNDNPVDLDPVPATDLDPPGNGNANIDISSCMQADIEITVTYVLDIPTTSKGRITKFYAGGQTAPPTEPSTTSPDPATITPKSGLSGGEIAGIVIGVLVGLALIIGPIVYCYIKKIGCFSV